MVTIEDIARLAGTSPMTVSRAINTPEKLKPSTLEKINKIIEETGYRPNMFARSLVRGKSKTIGVLTSNLYNQVYADILSAIEKIAYKNGFVVINANVDNYSNAQQALDMLICNQVDGIILLPLEMNMLHMNDYRVALHETDKFLKHFKSVCDRYNLTVVTISQKIEGFPDIAFDFEKECEISINYLIEKGYTDIAMLNSNYPEGLWKAKEDKYRCIMEERGLAKHILVCNGHADITGGRKAMEELLSKHRPRAVYCANDNMAGGAIQAIGRAGLRIPEDIAVMGNDDFYICEYLYPRLTTVSLGATQAGTVAVERLLGIFEGQTYGDTSVTPFLCERESV